MSEHKIKDHLDKMRSQSRISKTSSSSKKGYLFKNSNKDINNLIKQRIYSKTSLQNA